MTTRVSGCRVDGNQYDGEGEEPSPPGPTEEITPVLRVWVPLPLAGEGYGEGNGGRIVIVHTPYLGLPLQGGKEE